MSKTVSVRVDDKGRLTLPASLRKQLGVEPGDVFFMQAEGGVLRLAKTENPFDGLARHAMKEHEAGKTRDIRDIAKEWGVDLEGDGS